MSILWGNEPGFRAAGQMGLFGTKTGHILDYWCLGTN